MTEIRLKDIALGNAFIAITKDHNVQLFRKEPGLGPQRFDSASAGCIALWEGVPYATIDHILCVFEYKLDELKIYRALTDTWQDFYRDYTDTPQRFRTEERNELYLIAALVALRPIKYQAGFLSTLAQALKASRTVQVVLHFAEPAPPPRIRITPARLPPHPDGKGQSAAQ